MMMHDAAASSERREASSTGPLLVRSPRLTRLACHVVLSPAPHAVLVLLLCSARPCPSLSPAGPNVTHPPRAPALPSPLLAPRTRPCPSLSPSPSSWLDAQPFWISGFLYFSFRSLLSDVTAVQLLRLSFFFFTLFTLPLVHSSTTSSLS
jgi:hypothetical protein